MPGSHHRYMMSPRRGRERHLWPQASPPTTHQSLCSLTGRQGAADGRRRLRFLAPFDNSPLSYGPKPLWILLKLLSHKISSLPVGSSQSKDLYRFIPICQMIKLRPRVGQGTSFTAFGYSWTPEMSAPSISDKGSPHLPTGSPHSSPQERTWPVACRHRVRMWRQLWRLPEPRWRTGARNLERFGPNI